MISFHTLTEQNGKVREFSCFVPELEVGFAFLNAVVASGHILIKAWVDEDGHTTHLPNEAFDGQWSTGILKELELDWKQVLNQPS